MLERKHIEAIRYAWEHILDDDYTGDGVYAAISAALSACDESQCVWTVETWTGDVNEHDAYAVPGCGRQTYSLRHGFTYCPHCGRKIAPLPAAPEVKP